MHSASDLKDLTHNNRVIYAGGLADNRGLECKDGTYGVRVQQPLFIDVDGIGIDFKSPDYPISEDIYIENVNDGTIEVTPTRKITFADGSYSSLSVTDKGSGEAEIGITTPLIDTRITKVTAPDGFDNNVDDLQFINGAGNGIAVTHTSPAAGRMLITITNTKPDVDHNTDTMISKVSTADKNRADVTHIHFVESSYVGITMSTSGSSVNVTFTGTSWDELPSGSTGDILYHNGASWVVKAAPAVGEWILKHTGTGITWIGTTDTLVCP